MWVPTPSGGVKLKKPESACGDGIAGEAVTGVIVTAVAFTLVQLIWFFERSKEHTGVGDVVTVIVRTQVTVPPGPVAVSVYVVVVVGWTDVEPLVETDPIP